jgi:Protein of unknown function (DUF3617)
MRRSAINGFIVLIFAAAVAGGFAAFGQIGSAPVGGPAADQPGFLQFRYVTPGLWEMRVTGAWVDQRAVTSAQMEMLANTPAGKRVGLQAVVKPASIGNDGMAQMCFTPAMTSGGRTPIVHPENHCETRGRRWDDNHATFRISCRIKGDGSTTTDIWTDRSGAGDHITVTVIDTTHEVSGATHVIRTDTKLDYVRRDCGDVKPITPTR